MVTEDCVCPLFNMVNVVVIVQNCDVSQSRFVQFRTQVFFNKVSLLGGSKTQAIVPESVIVTY